MYKRIMAAIDDGFADGRVLPAAIELARLCGAKLALCHALDQTMLAQREAEPMLPGGVAQAERNMRAEAHAFLEKAADLARRAGVEVEIRLAESESEHVTELLATAAEEWQADLLVVGMHEHRGVERLLGGGIAERLARKAGTSLHLVCQDGSL